MLNFRLMLKVFFIEFAAVGFGLLFGSSSMVSSEGSDLESTVSISQKSVLSIRSLQLGFQASDLIIELLILRSYGVEFVWPFGQQTFSLFKSLLMLVAGYLQFQLLIESGLEFADLLPLRVDDALWGMFVLEAFRFENSYLAFKFKVLLSQWLFLQLYFLEFIL